MQFPIRLKGNDMYPLIEKRNSIPISFSVSLRVTKYVSRHGMDCHLQILWTILSIGPFFDKVRLLAA